MAGVLVNAADDSAVAASVSFTVAGTLLGFSNVNGTFTVGFPVAGSNRAVLSAAGFVDRQTGIAAPGSNLRLSLIPSSFDLTAFNQMFRHASVGGQPNGLTRWRTPPGLTIERRVLQFTTVDAVTYQALEETMTQAEVDEVFADLLAGYELLTAGRIGPITSIATQQAEAAATVTPRQNGRIVVTRQAGLTAATNFWGYARWSTTSEGEVTSAVIILDRDFERSTSPFHRSLRMHELGHALGCQHVTGRESVMNSNARFEPNTFDQQAARIATLRPTGNRPPDIDPLSHTATSLKHGTQSLTWHGAH